MRRLRKDKAVPSVLPERSGHSSDLSAVRSSPIWDVGTIDYERVARGPEAWKEKVKEKMKGPWLGKIVRLPCGPGELPYAPAWMVTEGATVEDLMEAVRIEWQASGDLHHVFIESLDDDGMWILIGTGS